MTIHDIIYLSIVGLGIVLLSVFYSMLGRATKRLPHSWKQSSSLRSFRISILFLVIYLLITLVGETIAIYLASHNTYNNFVICINFTLFTPFLFGFFFIHTPTNWKRYSYVVLYVVLIAYFTLGGYYHPDSVFSNIFVLLFSSIFFLVALIHLTDLLVNPKSEYFKFQLMISICVLIYNLFVAIITTSFWLKIITDLPYPDFIYDIHLYNIILYYFSLDLIVINEIRKLYRNYIYPSTKA